MSRFALPGRTARRRSSPRRRPPPTTSLGPSSRRLSAEVPGDRSTCGRLAALAVPTLRHQEGAVPGGGARWLRSNRPPIRPGCEHARAENPDPAFVLESMGRSCGELIADRGLLLVQLHSYAACADPDIRAVVRSEFASVYRRSLGCGARTTRRVSSGSRSGCSATSDRDRVFRRGRPCHSDRRDRGRRRPRPLTTALSHSVWRS